MAVDNKSWHLITLRLAPEAEELVVSALFDLGSTGTVVVGETPHALEIGAYFGPHEDSEEIVRELKARLDRANLLGCLHETRSTRIEDEDWLRKWKEGFDSVEVGDRLLIAPSWKIRELAGPSAGPGLSKIDRPGRSAGLLCHRGRLVIQIDPGMAFGTGTHETTRLCLEAIERNWKGHRFLDVGTGTGILAIAAARLIPGSEVVAIDIDPLAVQIARENLAVNGLTTVDLSVGEVRKLSPNGFDLVVANLTAGILMDLLDSLAEALLPSGCLILSGILTDQASDLERALERKGFTGIERTEAGEWACLIARTA